MPRKSPPSGPRRRSSGAPPPSADAIRALGDALYPTMAAFAAGMGVPRNSAHHWLTGRPPNGPTATLIDALLTWAPPRELIAAHQAGPKIATILAEMALRAQVPARATLPSHMPERARATALVQPPTSDAQMSAAELTTAIMRLAPGRPWYLAMERVADLIDMNMTSFQRYLMGNHIEDGMGGSRRAVPAPVANLIRAGVAAADHLDLLAEDTTLAQMLVDAAKLGLALEAEYEAPTS